MLLISRSAGVLANHSLEGSFLLNHQEFLISQDSICGFQAAVCTHRGFISVDRRFAEHRLSAVSLEFFL